MRIVIDTNVIASALFFGGKPRDLLELVLGQELEAFVSAEITEEYKETVDYLCHKYPRRPVAIPIHSMLQAFHLIKPQSHIQVCRDPDDDKFIECAVDSKSLYIVSGDKDLLSVEHYDDIQIMTVADFLRMLS